MSKTLRLIAAAAVLCSIPASAKPKAVPGAKLAFARGTVTVESQGRVHPGETGEPLNEGDAVTTGDKGTAVVELADGSRLKLRESGRMVLKFPAPRSPVTDIFLSFGSVFAKVAKQAPGAQFHVSTPSAVAAVRGTRFFTAYGRAHGKARDLWVCVNEGAVEVTTTASARGVRVPAGKGVLIKSGLDTTKPQAYDWTKTLNWNMDPAAGTVEDKTDLDGAYADLLDQDYH
ncbi:MAG: FecR domain-containing protein [Elusimicrobia bacterium]|nr:FecR domain-containing protein [Elusimicrobiota bacterium]